MVPPDPDRYFTLIKKKKKKIGIKSEKGGFLMDYVQMLLLFFLFWQWN